MPKTSFLVKPVNGRRAKILSCATGYCALEQTRMASTEEAVEALTAQMQSLQTKAQALEARNRVLQHIVTTSASHISELVTEQASKSCHVQRRPCHVHRILIHLLILALLQLQGCRLLVYCDAGGWGVRLAQACFSRQARHRSFAMQRSCAVQMRS